MRCCGNKDIRLCALYLPPAGQDKEWLAEVGGLDKDLTFIMEEDGVLLLANILILGDLNFQPAELGDEPSTSSVRENRWQGLKKMEPHTQ